MRGSELRLPGKERSKRPAEGSGQVPQTLQREAGPGAWGTDLGRRARGGRGRKGLPSCLWLPWGHRPG